MPQNEGNILTLSMVGAINGQRILTTLAYRALTESSLSDQDLYNNFMSQVEVTDGTGTTLGDRYLQTQASNYQMAQMRCQFIHPTRKRYHVESIDEPGQITGDCEAQNLAAVLTKQTALSGRAYVGSIHLPVPTSEVDNGLVKGTYFSALDAFRSAVLGTVTTAAGDSYKPVLLHRAAPAISLDLQAIVIQGTVRVMRRRTFGLGE